MSRLHYLIRKYYGVRNHQISVLKSRHPGHVREIAARAAQDGCDLVVAVGGDGTVNQVAHGLINTESALGILPAGSGNGFASNMGLPRRLDKALEVLRDPSFTKIDVGCIDDHIFLVSSGIGWEAVIATMFEGSRLRGVIPYAAVTISTYLQYEPQEIELVTEPDGWNYRGRPTLFTIANLSDYGFGITIAPDARPDDGMLDVCLIPRHSLLMDVKATQDMMRRRTDLIPGYIGRKAQKVTVRRSIAGNIHVDGTPIPAGLELRYTTLPGALRVAVKKTS